MKTVNFIFERCEVFDEISQTTSYTGAKMEGDPSAYDRIFTTDADSTQLDRFWHESCSAVCTKLRKNMASYDVDSISFELRLELSSGYDETLTASVRSDLNSYLVMSIAAKWFVFTNKAEAQSYAEGAAGFLESAHRKLCCRKKLSQTYLQLKNKITKKESTNGRKQERAQGGAQGEGTDV